MFSALNEKDNFDFHYYAGSTTTVSENNNYAAQTFQSIQPGNATTGTVFASVVGQGQCATPLRLAVRGGTSCWTQTAPSEPSKKFF